MNGPSASGLTVSAESLQDRASSGQAKNKSKAQCCVRASEYLNLGIKSEIFDPKAALTLTVESHGFGYNRILILK